MAMASMAPADGSLFNGTAESTSMERSATLRKGLLWVQRDKLFSRWKERYFVLTADYLNCFKKGTSRISEMGEFLYKVHMTDTSS